VVRRHGEGMIDPSDDWFASQRPRKRTSGVYNCLTLVVLACFLPLCAVSLIIFINPQNPFNPFPPPAMPDLIDLSQVTLAPTDDPAIDQTHPAVPLPTNTGGSISTGVPGPIEVPPVGTIEPMVDYPYSVLNAPAAVFSGLITSAHNTCEWMGVGGQVVSLDGKPITAVKVELGGALDGKNVSLYSLSGTTLQYGPAGFEFSLSDLPAASYKTLWIRLLDENDQPLSARVYFDTYASCDKNLVIINFKRVK